MMPANTTPANMLSQYDTYLFRRASRGLALASFNFAIQRPLSFLDSAANFTVRPVERRRQKLNRRFVASKEFFSSVAF